MTGQEPLNPPCVILAGGLSRRMGEDKAGVLLAGRPMLDHVITRMLPQTSALALNAPAGHAAPDGLPLVPDTIAGHRGPLAGILAAMRYVRENLAHASHVLTVPIDSPFLPNDLMARLSQVATSSDVIAIATSNAIMHPVCGLWPVSGADALQAFLEGPDEPRVRSFLESQKTVLVDFPQIVTTAGALDPFLNLNTRDDLENARRFVEAGA